MAYFFNESTKTYIVSFSKLFSDIHVKRFDSVGIEQKDIKVPLIYGSKRKLSYMLQRNNLADSSSLVLPAISFNLVAMEYNSERKLNPLNTIQVSSSESLYEGMPWDFLFDVTIRTKYQSDYYQILEQILYLFKPEVSLDIKELKLFPSWVRDTKVVLQAVSLENETEMTQDEDSIRDFRATLSFKLQGFIYPGSQIDTRIEHIDINFKNKLNQEIINLSTDWLGPLDDDIKTTITEHETPI